jgi:hypothetical protein
MGDFRIGNNLLSAQARGGAVQPVSAVGGGVRDVLCTWLGDELPEDVLALLALLAETPDSAIWCIADLAELDPILAQILLARHERQGEAGEGRVWLLDQMPRELVQALDALKAAEGGDGKGRWVVWLPADPTTRLETGPRPGADGGLVAAQRADAAEGGWLLLAAASAFTGKNRSTSPRRRGGASMP